MAFFHNKFVLLNGIGLAVLLCHSIYRDILLEKQYPADLRNRVVGARLQKDGKLPYGYAWYPQDGIRYYDVDNKNQEPGPSNITASPFFHQLLYPFIELPQRTISRIWFWLQYFFLFGMIFLSCRLTHDKLKQWLILNLSIIFTATEAWKSNIAAGQIYLFESFLIALIFFCCLSKKRYLLISGGIGITLFVLTRPIGLVLFIPLLIQFKRNITVLASALTSGFLYGIFVLSSHYESDLYKDYFRNLKLHASIHLNAIQDSNVGQTASESFFSDNMEGFNMREVERQYREHPIRVYAESASAFVVYYKITDAKIPPIVLYTANLVLICLLSFWFFLNSRKFHTGTLQALLLGFTMYMCVELLAPIFRHQYNTVQWLAIILAGSLLLNNNNKTISVLIVTGLLLNISNTTWLPMRHLLGECCWLIGILLLVFGNTKQAGDRLTGQRLT